VTDAEREAFVVDAIARYLRQEEAQTLALESINRNLFLIRVFLRGEADAVEEQKDL
jgi:hypothetical protein